MSLWSRLVQLDVKMRQAMAVYLIIPLFGLAIPVSLFVLGQSYVAYRSLADRGVQAIATIQTVAETGGRHNRNAVTPPSGPPTDATTRRRPSTHSTEAATCVLV